jgi:hypothetical protein
MVILFMYFTISKDKRIVTIAIPIFMIGFVMFYLKALYDTFIIWKKDKEDGDQEAILEYIETYSRLPHTGKGSAPGLISASFRIHSMFDQDKLDMAGEIVSLSGDIKNYDFVEGNRYKAKMRMHSKRLIDIEPFGD